MAHLPFKYHFFILKIFNKYKQFFKYLKTYTYIKSDLAKVENKRFYQSQIDLLDVTVCVKKRIGNWLKCNWQKHILSDLFFSILSICMFFCQHGCTCVKCCKYLVIDITKIHPYKTDKITLGIFLPEASLLAIYPKKCRFN